MEIMFVRHGETIANRNNWYYGLTDSPVTDRGKEQGKAAGIVIDRLNFKPDVIYMSERIRTHETLDLMGFDKNKAIIDSRINEQNMGVFECMTYQEIAAKYPGAFDEWNSDFNNYKPAGGESHLELVTRVKSFLEDLIEQEKNKDRRILIVSHGGVMHSVYTYINRENLDSYYSVYFNNCAMLRAKYFSDRLVMDAIYNPEELLKILDRQPV